MIKYLTVVILAFLFWGASILSGLWLLLSLLTGQLKKASYIFQAQDRLLAAELGWDGRSTVSKECGKSGDCRFCKAICKILDKILEKDHCKRESGN